MPFGGNGYPWADVVAYPFPSVAWLDAGEKVKTRFKPGSESMGNFQRLMQRVDGRKHAVDFLPLALNCEITMDFHHGFAHWNGISAINLNFVIVLALTNPGHH